MGSEKFCVYSLSLYVGDRVAFIEMLMQIFVNDVVDHWIAKMGSRPGDSGAAVYSEAND